MWKIRALYERMLTSTESYLKFKISNKQIAKAKSIYYRVLQNCCWYKDLVLDGVQGDLKQALNIMAEKQMRIHTPLEEVILLIEHCVQ
ncbi:nuclear exosome regulator NRDE2 isoform X1 [Parasteatoda tepidariorum]|uniref:nuclear exosome regulator NRDE2 isoform X1 n=1 Tax=Parasteatoda tepidariorum TaxID=114398 RepID=UPI0039BD2A5D